jgi:hypothetical protein
MRRECSAVECEGRSEGEEGREEKRVLVVSHVSMLALLYTDFLSRNVVID